jgi:hypothetical protein
MRVLSASAAWEARWFERSRPRVMSILAGRRHISAFFNRVDEKRRVLRSFFTRSGGTSIANSTSQVLNGKKAKTISTVSSGFR